MSVSLIIPWSSGLIEKSERSAKCRVVGSAKWSLQCKAKACFVLTLQSRRIAVTSRQIHHNSVSCALRKPPMGMPVVPCNMIKGPMMKKQLSKSSISTYSFVYHLYVSGRRHAFVAHGVARKVLKTRRARTMRTTRTDQVTRTEDVARRTRASRGTCRIEITERAERAERAARRFAHGRTSRRGRVLTVGYPAYAVVPQGSHWSHG